MATTLQSVAWETTGEDKRRAVRALFAEVADNYDQFNSVVSLRSHQTWRREAIAQIALKPGESVLDVCCGTGDFCSAALEAVGETGHVFGVDFCAPMLRQAARKTAGRASLGLADATRLPFMPRSFDAVTVGWGLRNVPDIKAALREISRVLKPGGRFVSIDMARPTTPLSARLPRPPASRLCRSSAACSGTPTPTNICQRAPSASSTAPAWRLRSTQRESARSAIETLCLATFA